MIGGTSDNSRHRATVLRTLAQIRQSRTSYVGIPLYEIADNYQLDQRIKK